MAMSYRKAGEHLFVTPHGSDHRCEATTGPWARAIGLCWCMAYLRPTNALALLVPVATNTTLAMMLPVATDRPTPRWRCPPR
jgi:hypothetical protein